MGFFSKRCFKDRWRGSLAAKRARAHRIGSACGGGAELLYSLHAWIGAEDCLATLARAVGRHSALGLPAPLYLAAMRQLQLQVRVELDIRYPSRLLVLCVYPDAKL